MPKDLPVRVLLSLDVSESDRALIAQLVKLADHPVGSRFIKQLRGEAVEPLTDNN